MPIRKENFMQLEQAVGFTCHCAAGVATASRRSARRTASRPGMNQEHGILAAAHPAQSLNQQPPSGAHALEGGCVPVHGAGLCSSTVNRFARVQPARSVSCR